MSTPATSSEPSSSPATPAPASSADDRVRNRNVLARYLSRPEIGSLFGVLAIALFFLIVAEPFRHMANTGTILYQAATIGIMAVPVALLMVAGEFDLSAGVAVTTAGLSASLLAWYFNFHVWAAVGLSLLIALAIGALNGFMLNRSGLPSFLITLATFFVLQGVNLGVTRSVTGGVASNDISDMAGFDSAHAFFAASMKIGPVNLKIPVLFWIILTIIAAFVQPALDIAQDRNGGAAFVRVIARAYAENNDSLRRFLSEQYGHVQREFAKAIQTCLPQLGKEQLYWRLDFLSGALTYAMADFGAIKRPSGLSEETHQRRAAADQRTRRRGLFGGRAAGSKHACRRHRRNRRAAPGPRGRRRSRCRD